MRKRYWTLFLLIGSFTSIAFAENSATVSNQLILPKPYQVKKQIYQNKNKKFRNSPSKVLITNDHKPARRAKPSPFDPLFPITEYFGPAVTIGVPNTDPIYPLTKLLWYAFPPLKHADIRIYGWVNPSFNLSTSKNSNSPMGYPIVPNMIELDQLILRIERTPNTVQTDHIDWGFRLTNLYGIDYRFTIAQGIFSDQLLQHNNLYGYDPVEAYGEIYFPRIAEGLLLTIGRYISPADIEGQLAPDNYLFTHSLMNTYDGYTQTGINATIKFNDRWTILVGLHAGNDVAPWAGGAHIPSLLAMVRWISDDNKDSVWGGIDSLNAGKFTDHHDNLQQYNVTWTHIFNPGFFIATELYYIYQWDAVKGGTCIFGPIESFGGGGGCGPAIPGYSSALGAVNYIELKVSAKSFLSFRTDYLGDFDGERTGFATSYMSFTIGIAYQPFNLLVIRPEARYEFAFKGKPYDRGTSSNQAVFAIDAICRF